MNINQFQINNVFMSTDFDAHNNIVKSTVCVKYSRIKQYNALTLD